MRSENYSILSKINSPADLKALDISLLPNLAEEIRSFLISSLSETGGHLASNLGVTELTIALHRVFESPEDRIVWDVGHQSYVHKILTGRRGQFPTLRRLDGLSGFPKAAESPCDSFDTGHASTSISAALGMCAARDLLCENRHVIAVTGDGSMTGGLAYEALNNAGEHRIIIILNDNGMSISESVGGLSEYLSVLRTKGSYLRIKRSVKGFLERLPVLGKPLHNLIDTVWDGLKRTLLNGGVFQSMGLNYIGPIDGHDLPLLIKMLSQVKEMDGPVLLHVLTKKGKGYDKAENAPGAFHGIGAFDINTGRADTDKTKITFSDAFGGALLKLAGQDKSIVAITAAMPDGTCLTPFKKAYPERFFDVGIAEGHAVTFAAGLAKDGMRPVFAVYSTFLQRGYDQLLHDVCLTNQHVVFAVDRAGVSGPDGETHQGLYDLSFLLHMPNMRVMCPKDMPELEEMLALAVRTPGPAAIRYPRARVTLGEGFKRNPVKPYEAELLADGKDLAIVCIGVMAEQGLAARKRLAADGFSPALYNARFAKPLDNKMLKNLLNFKYIITVEDNCAGGGFGAALDAALALEGGPGRPRPYVRVLAFPDKFIEHGGRDELLKIYGLDAGGIYNAARTLLDGRS